MSGAPQDTGPLLDARRLGDGQGDQALDYRLRDTEPLLDARGLTVRYGELTLVEDVSFSMAAGERLMIVGPNGAGKSTLVKAITQDIPYSGLLLFDGDDLGKMRPIDLARRIGMLMQTHYLGYAFTVEEVVRLGRYAHRSNIFAARSDSDERQVAAALEDTGLTGIASQSVLTLSGGELQRTFLAQVFAQDPQLLILDEPTNHLDLVYQKRLFELLDDWLKTPGRAVLAVVHDLNLARTFATRILLMDKGRVVASGSPDETLTPQIIDSVYQMDVSAWMRSLLQNWR